jgi:hypothetical protein
MHHASCILMVQHNAAYLIHLDIQVLKINFFEAKHITNVTPRTINNRSFTYLVKYSLYRRNFKMKSVNNHIYIYIYIYM